jgi:hypothetical protein
VAISPFSWVAPWPSLLWAGAALLAIAALCLGLGVFPRLAAVTAWGLLAALQDRNPALYMAGDRYLLLLIMWCVLLPTGARLSLRPAPVGVTRIRSWAGAGLLLQVMFVYVATGLKKTGPAWFDGTALWYALYSEPYVTAAGHWLRSQTALIGPLSFAVKWVEPVGPLLVLSPWRNQAARLITVGLFWAFHLGLQIFHAIGVFQLVGLAAWLVFLPSVTWERRASRHPAEREIAIGAERRLRPARWSETLALVPLTYLIITMTCTLTGILVRDRPYPVPALVNWVATDLHLSEGWAMFTGLGHPGAVYFWFLVPGQLADGSEVEVLRRAPLDWSRPSNFQSAQRGFRWSQYLLNAIHPGTHMATFRKTHPLLLDYLCREWNARNEPRRRLERVELVMVTEKIPAPGSAAPAMGDRLHVASGACPPP